jgi:hypothetical protein
MRPRAAASASPRLAGSSAILVGQLGQQLGLVFGGEGGVTSSSSPCITASSL